MKSSRLYKGFGLSAIILGLCAVKGNADIKSMIMGSGPGALIPLQSLSATTGVPNDPINPNLFPVYFVEYKNLRYGFLLDGSEWSSVLMKRIEDAYAKGENITFFYDDDPADGFKEMNSTMFPNTPGQVLKIVYISTY
jgi:hypothetical protein